MVRRPLGFTLAAALTALLPQALPAAPHLVKDLNTLPYVGGLLAAEPRWFSQAVSYFTVDDPVHGNELWRTDGTSGGTERVTDVCAGAGYCGLGPSTVTVHAGRAYFTADDGFSGQEMWVSDGTPGSERRLRDVCPGPCGTFPSPVEEVGGRLLFLSTIYSQEPIHAALWQTDGTAEGTVPLQELCSGCYPLSSLIPLGTAARKALFYLSTPTALELWVTDGTAGGTRRFEAAGDIPLDHDSRIVPGDGFAWFWASDGIWRADGTADGTFRLKSLDELATTPTAGDHSLSRWTVWHGLLVGVLWQGEIIRSDGTPEGTFRMTKVPDEAFLSTLVTTDSEVLFVVADNQAAAHNVLWSSRGTVETTGPKLDLGTVADVRSLVSLGGRLVFFRGEPGTFFPSQLWVTDGTAAGTRRLPVSPGLALDRGLFPAVDHAFFFRDDPGVELWVTDGTDAGTHQVRDFSTGPGSSGPIDQAALGGKLVFSAQTSYSRAPLFVSDGTAAGTQLLSTNADRAFSFFRFGDRLLFSSTGNRGYRPRTWATDGTPKGTTVLASYTGFANPIVLGGQVLFSGFNPLMGIELWKTDGLRPPATLVKDIDPFIVARPHHLCEEESSRPVLGAVVGGRLLFAADDGRYGRELWASDGTPAGTARVRDINPGRSPDVPTPCEDLTGGPRRPDTGLGSDPQSFVLLGSTALFTADDGNSGRELWISNGTFPGTHRVADLLPGARGSEPHDLVRLGNRVYFLATNAANASNIGSGESLWKTDGSAQGTVRVRDLALDGQPSWGRGLTVAGGRLYFTVYNETTGAELWSSTGDAAGTGLVVDLNPGPGNAAPQSLTAAGGVLLFAADDGLTGLEPWRTDGTAAGTVQVGDISSGRDASSPGPFTAIKNLVMTGADDGVHGRELWAIPKADIASTSDRRLP